MKDCVFCKIINGEIPCHKIYEDDFVLAFLDISNDAYGHTLVVPKKHYESIKTCDNTTLSRLFDAVKKIGNHYVSSCGFDGYNILSNVGQSAGQSVMHLHVHIVPQKSSQPILVSNKKLGMFSGDDVLCVSPIEVKEELADICQKLKLNECEKSKIDDENCVVLFTDGACSGNPGAGGWSAILSFKGREKVLSGGEEMTTNNRMELLAVITGLENVKSGEKVKVFSDSAYVVNALTQGWLDSWRNNNWKTSGKGDVANKDLWQRLIEQMQRLDVEFAKVKGHSDNSQNNRCDALAREEVKKILDLK